jgi:hypothetical protein
VLATATFNPVLGIPAATVTAIVGVTTVLSAAWTIRIAYRTWAGPRPPTTEEVLSRLKGSG